MNIKLGRMMTKETQKVAVVIPFYRDSISAYEAIALQQCQKVLAGFPLIAIKPYRLTLPQSVADIGFTNIVNFDDKYFDSIQGYNALMLSDTFYKTFSNYEYILIHQLDAFVFADQLSYWCNQNYDYVGAPWLKVKSYNALKDKIYALRYYLHARFDIRKEGLPTMQQFYNRVGNGGFSLRRVKKFYELAVEMRHQTAQYLSLNHDKFNEDAFWSIEVNRKQKRLNIPPYKIGVAFAVEFAPQRAFTLNGDQLPFGCHAWDKHLDYWRPVFKQFGYDI